MSSDFSVPEALRDAVSAGLFRLGSIWFSWKFSLLKKELLFCMHVFLGTTGPVCIYRITHSTLEKKKADQKNINQKPKSKN